MATLSLKTRKIHDYETVIEIGDLVCKKSRKPFQNGKRVAEVIAFASRTIPDKAEAVCAVMLKGCKGSVTLLTVHKTVSEIELLLKRDWR